MNTNFYQEFINNEHVIDNINILNKYLASEKEIILCINIRSLNANYNKLQTFLNSLDIKPSIIVCTETWNLEYYNFFNISGYNLYLTITK